MLLERPLSLQQIFHYYNQLTSFFYEPKLIDRENYMNEQSTYKFFFLSFLFSVAGLFLLFFLFYFFQFQHFSLSFFFLFFSRRSVPVFSFFLSFLLIFWEPCVFSVHLRGNPVHNHTMMICLVFWHQINICCILT